MTTQTSGNNSFDEQQSPKLEGRPSFRTAITALMMRELLTRFGRFRLGWLFVLLDPVVHIGFLGVMFGLILKRSMPGADYMYFVTIGILSWDLVVGSMNRGMSAVAANAGLFSHRQVRPVTVILARVLIEFGILTVTTCVIWAGFVWLGHTVLPHSPVQALLLVGLLTLMGLGLALIMGILTPFFPLLERAVSFVTKPLFFASGIIFNIQIIPADYRKYLVWNPLLHGIELLRGTVFVGYDTSSVSLRYVFFVTLAVLLVGFIVNAMYGHKVTGER